MQNRMLQLNDPNMIRMSGQFGGNMMMQPNGMMTTEMAMAKRAMQNNRNAYVLHLSSRRQLEPSQESGRMGTLTLFPGRLSKCSKCKLVKWARI